VIVAFRHLEHDNSFLDTIDCLVTGSNLAHVQIIFSNGQVGGAWLKSGVRFRTIDDTIIYPFYYNYVEVNNLNERRTYNFIRQKSGQKFNIPQSFLSAVLPVPRKWHCSDIIYSALLEGGLKTKNPLPSQLTSPQRIYDILMIENGYKKL